LPQRRRERKEKAKSELLPFNLAELVKNKNPVYALIDVGGIFKG